MAAAGVDQPRQQSPAASAPFTLTELEAYLDRNIEALHQTGYQDSAAAIESLRAEAASHYSRLEELEQRLTTIEEKMTALARTRQSEEEAFEARKELDLQLRPYRSRMTADQLALLERQFLERRLLDRASSPRRSLFYLR